MTLEQADLVLDKFLSNILFDLRFVRLEELKYKNVFDNTIGLLAFPSRLDPRSFIAFTCHVGVRLEPLSGCMCSETEKFKPTISMPIHFLREDKRFTEWKFYAPEDLEHLREPILEDVKNVALPFILRYGQLTEVKKLVESENKSDWLKIGLNSTRRINLLAAIHWIEGDKLGALEILNTALDERKNALPKWRSEIENFRNKLATLKSE